MNHRKALKKEAIRLRRNRYRLKSRAGGRLRLCVFFSSRHTYAQLIDDERSLTLASASTLSSAEKGKGSKDAEKTGYYAGGNVDSAYKLGLYCGKHFLEKVAFDGRVVFDRGSKIYHGRVAAFAQGAREGGLDF